MSELVVQPSASGFLGLSELRLFAAEQLEPRCCEARDLEQVVDFSAVRVWDIAAVLWLTVALHHYTHHYGLRFRLRLPEGRDGEPLSAREDFDRSADFLRRWRFDAALRNIVADVNDILVPEQRSYFRPDGKPRRYYKPRYVHGPRGLLETLLSRSLVQIRNLTEYEGTGSRRVSSGKITATIDEFAAERVGDILLSQCGIDIRTGDLFAVHLIGEALMNVLEHPDATIAMMAISVLGTTKELIVAVVDNGRPIPSTIYPRFHEDHAQRGTLPSAAPGEYVDGALPLELRAAVTNYAMQPGISRKEQSPDPNDEVGMGLAYIRQDTIDAFGGKLRVLTDGHISIFEGTSQAEPIVEEWGHLWSGNLLRISIPLARRRSSLTAARLPNTPVAGV